MNPRALNFVLSCAAVLQKYDAERVEAERAAIWGTESTKLPKPTLPINGRKQTLTQDDIMRNYQKYG